MKEQQETASASMRRRGPARPRGHKVASTSSTTHSSLPRLFRIDNTPVPYELRLRRRIVGAVLCAIMALFLTLTAMATTWGQSIDTVAMEALMTWSASVLHVGRTVTGIISVPVLIGAAVVVAIVAVLRRRPTLAGRALGMLLAANATVQILKWLLQRPDLGVVTLVSNSLPSGHVAVAISLCIALVMVAPEWLRGPSAWFGWVWTSLVGVIVMAFGWHRISDVVVSVLITGMWALLLSPIETRRRHSVPLQQLMTLVVLFSAVVAAVMSLWALLGVDITAVAEPGNGYGFEDFLADNPLKTRLFAFASVMWIVATVGAVVNAVDRLSGQ
ncbi:phosphatase PAP2 family protein [Schaalia suimastitidis]|uniref:phosphatase PAP2 family protein n=1 Tax=Schaalia suimastitidis TaxID=121163 RepID=UPI0006875F66|nr:phosphatase PAP2 family protein [Schaalia suimastitidis]